MFVRSSFAGLCVDNSFISSPEVLHGWLDDLMPTLLDGDEDIYPCLSDELLESINRTAIMLLRGCGTPVSTVLRAVSTNRLAHALGGDVQKEELHRRHRTGS